MDLNNFFLNLSIEGRLMYVSLHTAKIACTRGGKSVPQKHADPNRQRPYAMTKRCNCNYFINLTSPKRLHSQWHITTIQGEHNHPLSVSMAPSYKPLTPDHLALINTAADKKWSIRLTMDVLESVLSKGGNDKGEFDRKQVINLMSKRRAEVKASVPESVRFLTLLNSRSDDRNPWHCRSREDEDNHLDGLFWMGSYQVDLYRRYSDVIIHDCTALTNRFNMPLHCFVIVDSSFRTRLVACALTSGQTEKDYAWVLEQLLGVVGGLAPSIVVIDQEHAMEAACARKVPQARLVSCIWHIHKNLKSNLLGALGARWEPFMKAFLEVSHSLTPGQFEAKWALLLGIYGGVHPKIPGYLNRLYKDRFQWAWPWTRTVFTAGIQSTQRVEKTHHLLKMFALNSQSTLAKVLEATTSRSQVELFRRDGKGWYEKSRVVDSSLSGRMFADIISVNSKFLGSFACNKMRQEMDESFGHASSPSDIEMLRRTYPVTTISSVG